MPSFQDSAVIFFLALLLFGPKKLPELARQLGKLMGEFRRASNEFRLQMEDELRASEQEERQKQIAAIESAAPKAAPALGGANASEAVSDHRAMSDDHVGAPEPVLSLSKDPDSRTRVSDAESTIVPPVVSQADLESVVTASAASAETIPLDPHPHAHLSAPAPVPIATSGDLSIMPPRTGLPLARSSNGAQPAQTSGPAPASSTDLAPAFSSLPHTAPPEDLTPPPPDRYNHLGHTPEPQPAAHTPAAEPTAQHG